MHEQATRHYEETMQIDAPPEDVFAFVDDHAKFSSHMMQSSWRMGGGRMSTEMDEQHGQSVGSHIRMGGRVLGVPISLDEVVTRREPPSGKEWETVGSPQLLVVGPYHMGIEVAPDERHSRVRVWIDYDLPDRNAWLGRLFGRPYARWCVRQMTVGVREHFTPNAA